MADPNLSRMPRKFSICRHPARGVNVPRLIELEFCARRVIFAMEGEFDIAAGVALQGPLVGYRGKVHDNVNYRVGESGSDSHAMPSRSPSSLCGSLAGPPAALKNASACCQIMKSPQSRSGPSGSNSVAAWTLHSQPTAQRPPARRDRSLDLLRSADRSAR